MVIEEIFKNVEHKVLNKVNEFKYNNMEYDSRKIKENDIFIALIGSIFDGHNYIKKAIENRAKLIIIERDDIEIPKDVNVVFVSNLRQKLGIIASNFYSFPQKDIKIVGITGTNGKTTTTYILESVLENSARIGTTGYRIGKKEYSSKNTTPESLDIIKLIKECNEKKIEYFIMEVSSHALSLGRVNMLEFEGAIFTNLTQDHLDFHKDMEEYFKAKSSIINLIKKGSKLVINKDDEYAKRLENISDTFSIKQDADITGKVLEYNIDSMKISIKYRLKEYIFDTKLVGEYNLLNILGAIKLLINLGYDIEYIISKIEKIDFVRGRFELVENKVNAMIVIDYAHTPDGLLNILKTLNNMKKTRIITLFGAGGDRDKDKRPKMGKIAQDYSDYIYLTSDNPRTENPIDILSDIESGLSNSLKYEKIIDRKEAIIKAINNLKENDILLIAGKGHEDYQIIGNEKIHFDDKEIAKEALENKLKI